VPQGCPLDPFTSPIQRFDPSDIELRNFSFNPNHIAVFQNQSPLTFRLTNTADISHNFTLENNPKNILLSVDLSSKESETVSIKSLHPGNYTFYCNKFLRRFASMEGMLMVIE
jgi:plastocyanin